MKKFENKNTEILNKDAKGNDYDMGYAELAASILDIVPTGGWSTDIMRQRIPLQSKLKAVAIGKTILLENAEVDLLHEIFVSKPKFQIMHQSIIDLEDYVAKLKSGPEEKVTSSKGKKN